MYVAMDALDIKKWRFVHESPRTSVAVSSILLGLVMVGQATPDFPLSFLTNVSKKLQVTKVVGLGKESRFFVLDNGVPSPPAKFLVSSSKASNTSRSGGYPPIIPFNIAAFWTSSSTIFLSNVLVWPTNKVCLWISPSYSAHAVLGFMLRVDDFSRGVLGVELILCCLVDRNGKDWTLKIVDDMVGDCTEKKQWFK